MIRAPALARRALLCRSRVDWRKLAQLNEADEEVATEIRAMTSMVQEVEATASSLPKDVPPIDWDMYRTQIKKRGFVDELKAKYESFKYPETDMPEFHAGVSESLDFMLARLRDHSEAARKSIHGLEEDREFLRRAHEEGVGVEDVLARFPHLGEEAEADVKKGEYRCD